MPRPTAAPPFAGERPVVIPHYALLTPEDVRDLLPAIVGGLILSHGDEWAALELDPEEDGLGLVGAASCQWRGRRGFYLFLRTSGLGFGRLVSARVLVESPTDDEWQAIRDERTSEDPDEIGAARYRYLYVPDEIEEKAQSVFVNTVVSVVPLSRFSGRAV